MPGVDILWGVEGASSDGPPQYAYDTRYDYDGGTGSLIYVGWALASPTPGPVDGLPAIVSTSVVPSAGPLTSGACWAIKKLTYDGSNRVTLIQFANGNTQMKNVWDNRAALSYQ